MLDGYKELYRFVRPYSLKIILALAASLPVGFMDGAITWTLRPYLDTMLLQERSGYLKFFPLLVIIFTVVQGICKLASNYFTTWVGRKIAMSVKETLFLKLVRNETAFFDRTTSGAILTEYNHDADLACSGLLGIIRMLIIRSVTSLSLLFVMFYNSWQLAIMAVIVFTLALFPLTRVRARVKAAIAGEFAADTDFLTQYNAVFNGNKVVASYNLQQILADKLKAVMNNQFGIALRAVWSMGGLVIFMHLMVVLGIAITMWMQEYLVTSGKLTTGGFVSFIASLLLLYNPVKNMSGSMMGMVNARMALDRIKANLRRTPAIGDAADAIGLPPFGREIVFENASFAYTPDRPILKNIDLTIRKGETVAIVGPSGGGKTTLVSLLPRFYDVQSGRITIDGADIRHITLQSLRNAMAIVLQDTFLFDGTIAENVRMGKPDADAQAVDAAIQAACLQEFVATLPAGLDTVIGERGILLSGGQRQWVAIARAFIKEAPIVILDKATSSLDYHAEAIVQQALENLMREKTVLIVAHRLTTIIGADRIVVIKDGEIAEMGNHAELCQKAGGVYAGLYASHDKDGWIADEQDG